MQGFNLRKTFNGVISNTLSSSIFSRKWVPKDYIFTVQYSYYQTSKYGPDCDQTWWPSIKNCDLSYYLFERRHIFGQVCVFAWLLSFGWHLLWVLQMRSYFLWLLWNNIDRHFMNKHGLNVLKSANKTRYFLYNFILD